MRESTIAADHATSPVGLASDQEVVELSLLLPLWQLQALESAARREGVTTGQMLRRVIGSVLTGPQTADRFV